MKTADLRHNSDLSRLDEVTDADRTSGQLELPERMAARWLDVGSIFALAQFASQLYGRFLYNLGNERLRARYE